MLRGFATINYWADDVEAATRWYSELLGTAPYFERPGPDGRLAYAEFRIGDYQHELGLADRVWAPPGAAAGPGGAIMYWHVDDIAAAFRKLLSMGAKEYQPITPRGDQGFESRILRGVCTPPNQGPAAQRPGLRACLVSG